MEEELEDFWKEIRPQATLVSNRPSDLKSQLALASEKTGADLTLQYKKYSGRPVNPDLLAELVAEGVQTFLKHWFDFLHDQDLAGLIELILEGSKARMSPEEMTAFVRALPNSLLQRICASAISSSTGIHALMALEQARRSSNQNYTLSVTPSGIRVDFTTSGGIPVSFSLYEEFQMETGEHRSSSAPV